jgi:hypothetical protein
MLRHIPFPWTMCPDSRCLRTLYTNPRSLLPPYNKVRSFPKTKYAKYLAASTAAKAWSTQRSETGLRLLCAHNDDNSRRTARLPVARRSAWGPRGVRGCGMRHIFLMKVWKQTCLSSGARPRENDDLATEHHSVHFTVSSVRAWCSLKSEIS